MMIKYNKLTFLSHTALITLIGISVALADSSRHSFNSNNPSSNLNNDSSGSYSESPALVNPNDPTGTTASTPRIHPNPSSDITSSDGSSIGFSPSGINPSGTSPSPSNPNFGGPSGTGP